MVYGLVLYSTRLFAMMTCLKPRKGRGLVHPTVSRRGDTVSRSLNGQVVEEEEEEEMEFDLFG